MFYIYKFINKVNGKLYIGKTNNLYQRKHAHLAVARLGAENNFYLASGHYNLLQRAITKYGADNFDFVVIEENEQEEIIFEREKYWIAFYKTNVCRYGNEFGYNLTDGGEGSSGRKHTETAKQKIRDKAAGRLHTKETKQQMSVARSGDGCGHNILTVQQIPEILRLRNEENLSYPTIGKMYGVSKTAIRKICTGKSWKHLV